MRLGKYLRADSARQRFSRARASRPIQIILLSFCALTAGASHAQAQGAAGTSEKFQQATEAMRAGRLSEAEAGFAEIVQTSPQYAEAHFNLGLVREELGRYDEAIGSFQEVLALRPKLHGANLFLGIAQYRTNRLEKSVAALQKEIGSYPGDANAWMWLGVVQLAAGHPEEATAALDKAAKLAPKDADILYHRGRAHLLLSKSSYEQMYLADPKSWRVHQVLAQANAEAEKHTDAIAEYQAAIKLAPKQPGLHEELGSEYGKAGKPEEAIAEFERELELDPFNAIARFKLGTVQVEQGDAEKGKASILEALRQKPDLKEADYYLGRAEARLGNDAAAVESFSRSISSSSDPEVVQLAWYQLAMSYRRMHRTSEAQQALTMFQKLKDESSERAQERLQTNRASSGQNTAPPPEPQKPK